MASLLQRVRPISWMKVVSKRQADLFPAGAINSPRRLFGWAHFLFFIVKILYKTRNRSQRYSLAYSASTLAHCSMLLTSMRFGSKCNAIVRKEKSCSFRSSLRIFVHLFPQAHLQTKNALPQQHIPGELRDNCDFSRSTTFGSTGRYRHISTGRDTVNAPILQSFVLVHYFPYSSWARTNTGSLWSKTPLWWLKLSMPLG